MEERRPTFEPWRNMRSWVQSRSAQMLFGLGLTAALPKTADAARKTDRQDGEKGREDDRSRDDGDNRANDHDNNRGEINSNRDDGKRAEDEKSRDDRVEDESRRSQRNDDASSENNDNRSKNDGESRDDKRDDSADGGGRRQESRRQNVSTESSDDGDDDENGGGRRHQRSQAFEQTADDEPEETTPPPAPTTVTPANPNVSIGDVSSGDDLELTVQSNPNVIASVSAEGGFAFARSGDVTVISGPDGPSIIQGEIEEVVTEPPPAEEAPADGGDNAPEFAS